MNPRDKERTIRRFEDQLKQFGRSSEAMGWRDKEQQELRFSVLAGIGDLHSKKVLDVGCGFGDLYAYLLREGIRVDYTGYDISTKIVEEAREQFPDLSFQIKDILTDPIEDRFDYVFSSGIFNWRMSDNMAFVKKMMGKMFELSNCGIAVNMMTNYVDYREEHLFYCSPEEILKFAKRLSRFVVLRHDYPLYEFTIYVYRKT